MATKLSKEYRQYLKSDRWQIKREFALKQADHRCQVCNGNNRLDVHHRTYVRFGNEDLADLTVMCRSCHELYHKSKDKQVEKQKKATKKSKKQKSPKPCISKQAANRQHKENQRNVAMHFVSVVNEKAQLKNTKPSTLFAQWIVSQSDWPIVLDNHNAYKQRYGYSSPTEAAALSSLWSIACQRWKNFACKAPP